MKTKASDRILCYGTRRIPYQLHLNSRKRLRITVKPDLTVRVDAPDVFSEDEILRAIQDKAPWVVRQFDELEEFHPLPTPHRYISGETFVYLGRQYRLKIEQGEIAPAKLRGRYLHLMVLDKTDSKSVKQAVDQWYRARAEDTFQRYVGICMKIATRHGIGAPSVSIRMMRTRWGSCTAAGRITLNLRLIHAPVHCIEYVIMHELCHIAHHDHSPRFYSLLTRCMPDWKQRRKVLSRIVFSIQRPKI